MALARWQRTIVDNAGNILPGAQVTVRREVSGAPLAVLYSDRDGAVPLGNPFTADATTAFAAFHAAGGAHRIDVASGSFSQTLRYVAVGTRAESDIGGDLSTDLVTASGAPVARTLAEHLGDTLSVLDFGAVADSDGTAGNGTDNRAAFNAALAAAALTGKAVRIPAGLYRISNGLVLDESADTNFLQPRASIVGDGARASYLIFDNGVYDGLTVVGPGANDFNAESKQLFHGFTLYKTDGAGNGFVGIDLARARWSDVVSVAWDLGCWCIDVQESLFENCLFVFNLHGFQATKDNFTKPNALTFISCTVGNNQNWGMNIVDPAVLNYYGGSIESNGGVGEDPIVRWGARVIWQDGSNPEGNQACTFNGVYFERNDGLGDLYFSNSALPMTWAVTNCNFNRGSSRGFESGAFGTNCISLEASGGFANVLNISGNGFGGLPRSGGDAYVPDVSRPYIGILTPTEPLTVIDIGNGYRDAVERPVWYSEGGVSVYRTESAAVAQNLVSNHADANPGPYAVLFRDSASPAASDFGGSLAFDFRNSAAERIRGAQIAARIIDATDGSEDIETTFFNLVAGAAVQSAGLANGMILGAAAYLGAGSLNAAAAVKSISPTAGIGYGAGAGGVVTQATNKTTGVTLNTVCGEITMHNASLAAGNVVQFTLTNSAVAAGDNIILQHVAAGSIGFYSLNGVCAAGAAHIQVRNASGGALAEAIVIRYTIIKGVTA